MRTRRIAAMAVLVLMPLLLAGHADAGWFTSRSIYPGNWPLEMAVDPEAGRLYVANSSGGDLAVFDTATLAKVASIDVGSGAHGVAFDAARDRIFVASSFANRLTAIDTATNALIGVSPATFPHGVGYDNVHNRLVVTSPSHGLITIFDADSLSIVGTIPVRGSNVAVDPQTGLAYVEDRPNLHVVDTVAVAVIDTIEGAGAFRPVIDPVRNRLYALDVSGDTVYVVDLATRSVVDSISVSDYPATVGVNSATGLIYVGHGYGGIDVIDPVSKVMVGQTDGHSFDIVADPSTNRVYVTDPNGYRLRELAEDLLPPSSTIQTKNLSVLRAGYYDGDPIVGTASDDFSGLSRVRVRFTGTGGYVEVNARLSNCVQRVCRWEARAPSLPGIYHVTSTATDAARNVEPAHPGVTVIYT